MEAARTRRTNTTSSSRRTRRSRAWTARCAPSSSTCTNLLSWAEGQLAKLTHYLVRRTLAFGRSMKGAKRRPPKMKVIQSRERAQALFEGWRKKLTNLHIELKRLRVIDVVPVDFLRDEPPEREGQPTQRFRGRLIFLHEG